MLVVVGKEKEKKIEDAIEKPIIIIQKRTTAVTTT
jgi:hypothetical protein